MAKPKYKAILFAPDGDWVTYFNNSDSVEEVWEKLANMGSLWFFYPIHGVIRDKVGWTDGNQRVISTFPDLSYLQGRSIRTFSRIIKEIPTEDLRLMLESGAGF